MASKIDIISNALLLIGDERISSTDETTGGQVAEALYDSTVENLLSAHPWRFAIAQFELNRLASAPASASRYQYTYQLPAGYIRAIQVFPAVGFEIFEGQVHANVPSMTMEYVFKPDETAWPPWFVTLVQYQLSAELANPVTEKTTLAEFWAIKARDQMSMAMSIDAQQRPNVPFLSNPLLEAHH